MLYHLVKPGDVQAGYRDHFINGVGKSLGLSPLEMDDIRRYAHQTECPIPKDEGARVAYFYHLLFLLRMRGKFEKEEKELCQTLGFRLCLNPMMVSELTQVVSQHVHQDIPSELMLNAVKRHYN